MEHAFHISDLPDLKKIQGDTYSRLYFGMEFCENLLPTPRQLRFALDFAKDHSLDFTFLTPVCFPATMEKVQPLLDMLPQGAEVVFNDWGMPGAIRERNLTPVHGRLLCTLKRDPRMDLESDALAYFRSHNIQANYCELLRESGVSRVEMENVIQGFDMPADSGLDVSLYYPFVACSVTRKCIFANIRSTGGKFAISDRCERHCTAKQLHADVDGAGITIRGNVQFYENGKVPENLDTARVNRLVFAPRPPNKNSFKVPDGA